MPVDLYEEARLVAMAAPTTEFTLPAYTGGTKDFAYLRNWVLDQVTSIYGVDASVFDTATVMSTSLLRDFVHRALYQTMTPNYIDDVVASPEFLGWDDVATGFRYPSYGLCGDMTWQMWHVYRAFGYQNSGIATSDAQLQGPVTGHVMSEVYVTDLGKYIVQDSTFNFAYRDSGGNLLSFYEARAEALNGTLTFDVFTNWRWYYDGLVQNFLDPSFEDYFEQHYLTSVYRWYDSNGDRVQYLPSLFFAPDDAHNAAVFQGGTFADQAAAEAAISAASLLPGAGWETTAAALRGQGYYVSGFAIANPGGSHASEWLTLRLASGSYVSIDLATSTVLQGSYDQLIIEALGGTVLNPGADLSAFLQATYLLTYTGAVMDPGAALPVPTDLLGTTASETLIGSAGIDRIFGYDGADVIYGSGGADYMVGGIGDDNYFVDHSDVVVIEQPGEGLDTVYASVDYTIRENVEILNLTNGAIRGTGHSGSYWIYGNSAANILDARGGNGTLVGGAGNDIYYLDSASDWVIDAVGEGSDRIYTSSSITLAPEAAIEIVSTYGTATTDAIDMTGSDTNNWLIGNAGANVLDGRGGVDTLSGYEGNDTYYVDDASDVVTEAAASGTDVVIASVSYALAAGVAVEQLTTTGTSTTTIVHLTGNELDNTLVGNAAANSLAGGAGNDSIWGYAGSDTMVGSTGNDTYYVDAAGDVVTEIVGEGTDVVITDVSYALAAGSSVETLRTYSSNTTQVINLTGNELANSLVGNEAANVLSGGGGNDGLWGYGGIDTLIGGAGDDSFYVEQSGDVVVEVSGEGTDSVYANVSYVLAAGVAVETLATFGSDTTGLINLTGNELNNTVIGNAAANILSGGGGADLLWGYAGADTMLGGTGNDTYYVDTIDIVTEAAGEGSDTIISNVSFALSAGSHVELVRTYGSVTTQAINFTGNELANTLVGNAAGNSLVGGEGNDSLWGYGGADTMVGGAGNDAYFVDSVVTITEASGEGTDVVYTNVSFTLGAGVSVETIATFGSNTTQVINLTGNELNNTLVGNAAANVLDGSGGADVMWAYGGNDTYYVDNAGDSIGELLGEGTDTVITTVTWLLGNNLENLTLSGAAAIDGTGNGLANILLGNSAANVLNGGAGNDTLTGGAGADAFLFNSALSAPGNVDTITDFAVAEDIIRLENAVFTALTATGTLASDAFIIGSVAANATDRLVYDSATGALSYDADGNGAGAQIQFATLTTGLLLAHTNFLVV